MDNKNKLIHYLFKKLNTYAFSSPKLSAIPPSTTLFLKADSGASQHYIRPQDMNMLQDIQQVAGPSVYLPDMTKITADQCGFLPIQNISSTARKAHIFPQLQSASLLSLGQLCDDDCTILMNKYALHIFKDLKHILSGVRNRRDGLWDVPLTPPTQQFANVILRKDTTKRDLISFFHGACFSPTKTTFLKAIKNGNFISWPGLTTENVTKYLQMTIPTALGHMKQERQNLQSTKQIDMDADFFPPPELPNQKRHEIFVQLTPFQATDKAYGDITGRFPYMSSRGNQYFLVIYDYDSNAILVEVLKSRSGTDIKNAYMSIYTKLASRGCAPRTFILDNEISSELTQAFTKKKIKYQLVPPEVHRRNAAERAIQTWKRHFISGLCTVDPSFPMSEWDRLVRQGELTLNLLRNSRVNPKLSSWAYIFGAFDFNSTPLAPPGTKVVVHIKPHKRASWDPHGISGFYTGPAMHHYRCYTCYIPKTRSERITDTVSYIPANIPIPAFDAKAHLHQALEDILTIVKNPPKNLPFLQAGDDTTNAIRIVAEILRRSTTQPSNNSDFLPPHLVEKISTYYQPKTIPARPGSFQHMAPLPRVPERTTQTNFLPNPQSPTPTMARLPRVPHTNKNAQFPPGSPSPTLSPNTSIKSLHPQERDPTAKPSNKLALITPRRFTKECLNHIQSTVRPTNFPDNHPITHFLHPVVNHIYNPTTGKKETIDSLRSSPQKERWETALSNEWGRLAQGNIHGVAPTDTIQFIHFNQVPHDRDVTYASFVCDHRPLKSEPWRVRIVVGGDKLSYNDDPGSPAASLLETKILINSVISDAGNGARFMSLDLKDYFLATPMERPEYMKVLLKYFPTDIQVKYKLHEKVTPTGYIYIKINKGMYGLKQAAILAYNHLKTNLQNDGYEPIPHTDSYWRHKTLPTIFCLCVDDFGVKYFQKSDINHLISSLQKYYKLSTDFSGKNYCGLTLTWNYDDGYVDVSMPDYVTKALKKFQHPPPASPQYAPHAWNPPKYGQRVQYALTPDSSPPLDKRQKLYVQSVVGAFLYFARAIDSTLLVALNDIAAHQARPTQFILSKCKQLLDYAATFPNVTLRFHASDMILHVDSDAAYLVQDGARSRIAGHYILSSRPPPAPQIPLKRPNAPILVECKTLRNVVASAAEAETGGLFHNAQNIMHIRHLLHSIGHAQPPTPLKTDNNTASAFVNKTLRQRKSKSWDMKFHWLRDRELQRLIRVFWDRGINNDADYFTKHHPPSHHQTIRSRYILKGHHMTPFCSHFPGFSMREGVLKP